ncbi:phosphoribosylamine--glycine ligase [uncultured Lactobacillus sp.]|uniref:phosphoribosylamine--glycine ligase n=1 Tax=uncultured Lactobacillus sp. TaxID=153152 RepID=UPI002805DC5B|nr:phosphoribosylamine--glycine ligase [uncultured Lactobacillus sp.]
MKDKLTLLVVGSGGREFAVAKKLKESPHVETVYCAPGNVGMQTIGVKTVPIDEMDLDGLLEFAQKNHIDWTFVGPENVLCAGIVDKFNAAGEKIFGPNQRAAQLEGSKDYALRFMSKYNIPTARYETFTSPETCIAGLKDFSYPVVIKEDGLAGGKGVTIAKNKDIAEETIQEMFAGGQKAIVLEECLVGPEYSMFVVVSGDKFTILPMAQDHKRVGDGDIGPNTGGMGSYSPLPQLKNEDRQSMIDEIVKPTIHGLVAGNYDYHGILYIGLMMTQDGPKVIEYNVRLGDPETQVVLPRMKTDLAELVDAAVNDHDLPEMVENNKAVLGVVVCANGYPNHPDRDVPIGELPASDSIYIDYANVKGNLNNLLGDGGRLFMVIAEADELVNAQDRVYSYLSKLSLPSCFYRHDIGNRALLK